MCYYNNPFYKIVQYSIINKYEPRFLCKSDNKARLPFSKLKLYNSFIKCFYNKGVYYGYIFSCRY